MTKPNEEKLKKSNKETAPLDQDPKTNGSTKNPHEPAGEFIREQQKQKILDIGSLEQKTK